MVLKKNSMRDEDKIMNDKRNVKKIERTKSELDSSH